MTAVTKVRLRRSALLAGVLAIGWVAYDPCRCWMFADNINEPLHLKALPGGCEVLKLPQHWDAPKDDEAIHEQGGRLELELEFRQAPDAADEVFIAQSNRGEDDYERDFPRRYSKLKYKFRFPALAGRPHERINGLVAISEQEWNRGGPLPRVWNDKSKVREFQGLAFQNDGVTYAGKVFPKSDRFYWLRPALMTAGKQRLAVFSYGKTELDGHEVLGSDAFTRPWRSFLIDVYGVASGSRLALVRSWSCHGGEFNNFAWHGEKLLSVPLDVTGQQILVCGFK